MTISSGAGNDSIVNSGANSIIDGGEGDDSIYTGDNGNDFIVSFNYGDNVKIVGGEGKDYIWNIGNKVTIVGGTYISINGGVGNDSIVNSGYNVSINGGAGNDYIYNEGENILFKYAAGDGKDVISGFNDTSTLQIAGSTYSTKKSGSNIVVTVGNGSITLQGAATLETVKIVSDTMKITDSTKSPVTLNSSYKNADASTRTKAVKITGNASANSIVGGSDNDTLTGGKGNDSLWGGGGKDTFIYSSGKDVISGFGSDDLLKITGTFSASYNKSDKSIAFKVGKTSDAITLRDFGTTTTFHVNSTTYQLSGGKLRAR